MIETLPALDKKFHLIKQSKKEGIPIYVVEYPDVNSTGFSMVDTVRTKRGSRKKIVDLTQDNNIRETYLAEM